MQGGQFLLRTVDGECKMARDVKPGMKAKTTNTYLASPAE